MLPYISVFFIRIGLSVWQVGILRALEPLLTLVCSPLWGTFADKYSKHRPATTVAICGAGIFYFLFLFVPLITGVSPEDLVVDVSEVCPNNFQFHHYSSFCKNSEFGDEPTAETIAPFDTSTHTSSGECEQLCAAIRGVKGHSDEKPGYFLCEAESSGKFTCSHCASEKQTAHKGENKSSVAYGLSCSQVYSTGVSDYNSTHGGTEIISSLVPHVQNNVSNSCHQSACCQCTRRHVPNPRQGTTFAVCIVLAILAVAFNCNILMFFDAIAMELLKGESHEIFS